MSVPASFNLAASVAALFIALEGGGHGRMAGVGDSISYRPAWHTHVYKELGGQFGYAGYGYRGANADFKWIESGVVKIKAAYAGSGVNIVKGLGTGKRDPVWGIYTPDGIFSRLRGDGSLSFTVPAGHNNTLHYLSQPGGGDLLVYKNGILVQTIDTDGALGDVAINLPTGTKYKVMSAGADWVQVNALEVNKPTGFCFDRLARGQNNPADYKTGNTASTSAMLAALDHDLMTIETDWVAANPQSEASFIADITAYVAFVREANPDIGIVLIAHHATKVESLLVRVSEVMYQLAQDLNCGFIDHLQLHTNAELAALGYLNADLTHLSDAGGAYFAHYDAELMRATR